jgi:uncharacterized repeat protein (TIGR01451 family)
MFERLRALTVALIVTVLGSDAASAANNQATGDVNGDATAVVASNIFALTSSGALTLVKRAFLADGTSVPTGSTLAKGNKVIFMIYLDNRSSVTVTKVSIRDVLDPLFAYSPGTLKLNDTLASCATTTCTAAEEAALFAAVNGSAALTDAVDADVASYTAASTTIDVGNSKVPGNAQLNATNGKVLAVAFTVTMQ